MQKRKELKTKFRELIDDFTTDKNLKHRHQEFIMNEGKKVELAKKLRKALT